MPDIGLTFARPEALWLLLAVPVIAVFGLMFGSRRRRVPRLAVGLRVLVVTMLVAALADPLITRGGSATSAVFVVDHSRSLTDQTIADANTWVMNALGTADGGDRAAVVTFGGAPVLAQPAADVVDIARTWTETTLPDGDAEVTDISSALALGRALPLGGSERVVLLTDGSENTGAALDQAAQAAADGTPIDVVLLPGVGGGDLRISGVTAPTSTWQGEPFSVVVSVATADGGTGAVELLVDGEVAQRMDATFRAGVSSFQFNVADLPPGFHALAARVIPMTAADAYPENNQQPLAVIVRDQPRLLVVAPEGVDSGGLVAALESQGGDLTVVQPVDVPSQLSEIGQYDAVLLNNVPAGALTLDQQANLQEVTRSLGRGLIVVGGTSAYGPGGYAGTPLEEALPVTVKVTDGKERERVALLLIMDRSGSMSYDPLGGTSKIEMAKEAARIAGTSLNDGDFVGILVFDDDQQWVIEMMEITGQADRDLIASKVAEIQPEGGTELYPALSLGFDAIRNVEADVRHVVVLTDGKSRSGSRETYQKLIDEVITSNTTLSTIAIGDDSDTDLLMFLAEQGGGRYHFTDEPADIPRLTLEEAQSAGTQSVLRGDFRAIQTLPSPILLGFDPELMPPVQGYDFAEPKPAAQVVLTSDRTDPLLTKWQYGLGRVVSWTGDDGADFNADWPAWDGYGDFWMAVVRWSLPDPDHRPLQVSVERAGTEAIMTVDSLSGPGDSGATLGTTTARVTSPAGDVTDLNLYQTGPGQYQVRVANPEPGAYQVDLTQQRGAETIQEMSGFAVPPSPELQPAPGGEQLLRAIAAQTGGRVLSLDSAGDVFSTDGLSGTALRQYTAIWYLPVLIALLALLAEIGIRTGVLSGLRRRG